MFLAQVALFAQVCARHAASFFSVRPRRCPAAEQVDGVGAHGRQRCPRLPVRACARAPNTSACCRPHRQAITDVPIQETVKNAWQIAVKGGLAKIGSWATHMLETLDTVFQVDWTTPRDTEKMEARLCDPEVFCQYLFLLTLTVCEASCHSSCERRHPSLTP